MATRAEIRADVELRLTKGKPSDDLELDPRQINFWIDIVRAKIIEDKIIAGGYSADISSSAAEILPPIAIQKETINEALDECNKYRYYIDIPGSLLMLPNDMAVVNLLTLSGTSVNRIRISDLGLITSIRHCKPSPTNMVFYRVNNRLYIIGPTFDFLNKAFLIPAVILSDTSRIKDWAEFPMPQDLVPALIDGIEAIARRQFQLPQDLIGDGIQ